ncbi:MULTISPECIES: glycine cleavage system aminomethyltransferase GcvT [Thermoactinomyces]|uniref:Aminomethyltransferase n=1 Tax=Thermoactinomyces daqus TaxID=1329516 RepID=A0A7W2AH41_9BACL|nr:MULTISPECIES: glycine cleavage system aminomethyltransferase GcvT [Thermoactinomyces]MBA4541319.1 glycine cleavage system aminomethyltransferase GcvT [Thermoactinomyces daqus]MBH8596792.1 glycine cleavage system aminomethyltransferase GcvT [Thermoactinomyces sp. CICC 10523]MBH8603553.1 glycine cleavage system aminomethyltransferase GcvT [Thermoactinomyces sp. CICC 10522]MBH8606717.1 glycine cleavage system aminomethyltransferase GcvT [Thermoactinomyces sp. CICC 10521]
MAELKKTPLHSVYCEEAKMVPFGGWEMPVQFSGIKQEHETVRTRAGLFDVSHMGEVLVKGPDALELIQRLTTNDAAKLNVGDAQYSIMCYENGGTVDDLLVYRIGEQEYWLVINAANIEKDVKWILKHRQGDVTVENISDQIAQLALQGPSAETVLQKLTDTDLSEIKFFKFKNDVALAGVKGLVSRTGYTGEDGFEIYLPASDAPKLWQAILEAGKEAGVLPCGLGARDTLRFEARLPLYGQELSETITPIEAGLGFAVKPEKGDFIGREVLAVQKAEGAPRKLVGLEMIDRGIPRTHYPVYHGEEKIGEVTTGTQSPTLKKNVGLALINAEYANPGEEVEVEIRGKRLKAIVVKTPFYKRAK